MGALPECPDTALYGLEIVRASRLEPGTIYPILQWRPGAGWIGDRGEEPVPGRTAGRSPWRYCRQSVAGCARAVHALQKGRDRGGLSRLLVAPTSLLLPRSGQVWHERSPSAPCRGQRSSWCRSQRSPGNGRLSSGSRAETQFASLDMRPIARRGGHGLVSGMTPVSPTRPGPRRQHERRYRGRCRSWSGHQLDVRVRCVALALVSVKTAPSKHCPEEGDKNVDS